LNFCAMPDSLRMGELGMISARFEIFILFIFCLQARRYNKPRA